MWKLTWDIFAAAIGIFLAYKVFLFSGKSIPGFGYFPLGIIFGLIALGIGALLGHGAELAVSWILFKLLKIRTQADLPF